MECKRILPLLSSYIDGEVSSEEKKAIEAHLKECRVCYDALSDLRQTVAVLGMTEDVPVPTELAERIKVVIRQEKQAEATKTISKKPKPSIFPGRALRYIMVFSGLITIGIAILIPLKAFWFTRIETKTTPMSSESQNVQQKKAESGEEGEAESRRDLTFDSLPTGRKVYQTSQNYNAEGVDKLLDFYKVKEDEKADSETFSAETRDKTIADMLKEANSFGLDSNPLAKCFETLMAQTQNTLPVYAEKAFFKDQEVWIVVVNEYSPHKQESKIRAYVFEAKTNKILYATDTK